MSNVRVSVFMPVYNGERYLAEAVQSVLDQSYRDLEFVAVDDGSTDGSAKILKSFADRDARVRFVSRPNKGAAAASNEALSMCVGEFVARLDADDVCIPGRIQKQVDFLDAHPDHVLIGSRTLMIDDEGLPIGDMAWIDHGHDTINRALLYGGWPVIHSSVMMRKAAIETVGGYLDYFPYEDQHLFLRLSEIGQIDNLPEMLVKYRRHAESALGKARNTMPIRDFVMKEARQRRGLPDTPPGTENNPSQPAKPAAKSIWQSREWAWTALRHKHVRTARKYAWRALREQPTSKAAWKLMYCALRGR